MMRLVSMNARKYFLAVMVSFLALATAGTAFAVPSWSSPTSVSGWNIHEDSSANGHVELYTSIGQYAFPLDAIGAQILGEIRDAKKSGHNVYLRLDPFQGQYCFYSPNGQVQYCAPRVWGVSQIQ
jgi:hypothetical protein